MAIMDEKGRLFGKVNLLDLVVVLAVVAVAGRFGYKYWMGRNAVPVGADKTIDVEMKFPAVAERTIEEVPVGSKMYDGKTNNLLGEVVARRFEPAMVMQYSEDGRVYEHMSKSKFDFYVTVRGGGRVNENAITLNGIEMKIGRANPVKNQRWVGYPTIWRITEDSKPH